MKNKFLTNKQFIVNASFGFLYYFFVINLVLNDTSRLYWMFAYFMFFLPVIYFSVNFLFPSKTINVEVPETKKIQEKVEPVIVEAPKTATEEMITKEFSIEAPIENPVDLELLESKHEFNIIMNHEMKTIMTGIIGIPSMLEERKLSKKDKTDLIDLLAYSSDNLMNLINEMLEFSQIESGKVELHESDFNLNDCLRKVLKRKVTLYANHLNTKEIKVNYGSNIENFTYFGDQNKIEQIISTLINNGIKFTNKGEINLLVEEIDVDLNNISNIKITVTDFGNWIKEEELPYIFEPYEQLKINNNLNKSSVGLAVVKFYLDLMEGEISIKLNENIGTEISLNLKLIKKENLQNVTITNITTDLNSPDEVISAEDAEMMAAMMSEMLQEEKKEEPPKLKTGGFILIVENNKGNQKFLEILLNKIGLSYKFVPDGQEAFEVFTQEYFYDLIFMDTSLSYLEGIEATKKIRAWENEYEKPPVPIISVTANTSKTHEQECIEAGINGFIYKPIQLQDVKDVLSRYFKIN